MDRQERRNPFSVPENYFEELTGRVMARVGEQKKQRRKNMVRFCRPYINIAATFALTLFVLQWVVPHWNRPEAAPQDVAVVADVAADGQEEDIFDSEFNPTTEEIIEYLASEMDNFDTAFASLY